VRSCHVTDSGPERPFVNRRRDSSPLVLRHTV
jgi:hypothetical protein